MTQENECPSLWTSEATDKIYPALLKFHANPPSLVKEGIIAMHGKERKYLTLDSILHAVRPAMASHGMFIMQHLAGDTVTTVIQHESGQFIASRLPFQTMSGSGTNNLQNLGGGLTYLRRYALTAILSIAADADDDGDTATGIEQKSKPSSTVVYDSATTNTQDKKTEPEKWLNKTTKEGHLTAEWSNMLKGIEMGTVTSMAQLRKYYKIAKKEAAEIESLLQIVAK